MVNVSSALITANNVIMKYNVLDVHKDILLLVVYVYSVLLDVRNVVRAIYHNVWHVVIMGSIWV